MENIGTMATITSADIPTEILTDIAVLEGALMGLLLNQQVADPTTITKPLVRALGDIVDPKATPDSLRDALAVLHYYTNLIRALLLPYDDCEKLYNDLIPTLGRFHELLKKRLK